VHLRSEKDVINLAIELVLEGTLDVLQKVAASGIQVSDGSKQIAEGAQSLAQGSTEQASSVEELSASIGEIATIGITDYAQKELGDIVFVDVTSEGETLAIGDVFGSIEAVKTVSDLIMPIAGVVEEVNAQLEDAPELVNKEPYGNGWLIKAAVVNDDDLNGLMSAEEYKAFIGK
jgi:glycine cleavage system H protein